MAKGNGRGQSQTPGARDTVRLNLMREKAFYLHVEGHSVRAIGQKLKIDKNTAAKYVREEGERRSAALEADRDHATATSIATYEAVKRRAFARADRCDKILAKVENGKLDAKISDHSLSDATKAQERIDRIQGVDAPAKIDAGLRELAAALADTDDLNKPLN
jgi:transposase